MQTSSISGAIHRVELVVMPSGSNTHKWKQKHFYIWGGTLVIGRVYCSR